MVNLRQYSFNNIIRLIVTLSFLKPSQIVYRLKLKLFGYNYPVIKDYIALNKRQTFATDPINKTALNLSGELTFLNKKLKMDFENQQHWNRGISKLWDYNLHYFNGFNHINSNKDQHKIFDSWIKHNPYGVGVGWEPYTISVRLINILKAYFRGTNLSLTQERSLFQQYKFLLHNIERDILGNHYLVNLMALVFCSSVFEDEANFMKALKKFNSELDEQILHDGMHFERSAMYHFIVTHNVMDVYNLAVNVLSNDAREVVELIKKMKKMFKVCELITYKNDEIFFLNDSCNGVAPTLNDLKSYAKKLDLKFSHKYENLNYLNDAGIFILDFAKYKFLLDCGVPNPKYQPGHSHAGSLSFELECFGQRVFVNSGIYDYENTPLRHHLRSTKSHNTVTFGDCNSSDVWHSFRVAQRAEIMRSEIFENALEATLKFAASHIVSYFRPMTHTRKIKWTQDAIIILDTFSGVKGSKVASFYLHPAVDISMVQNKIWLNIDGRGSLIMEVSGGDIEVQDTIWYPEFGKEQPNKCISINFVDQLRTDFYFSPSEI